MAKTPPITNVTSGFSSTTALNNNFEALKNGFDNTLSLDGSTPNAMQAELDLSNNSIINAGSVETDKLLLNGVLMTPSGVDPVFSGTVSSFGASLIDDADASTARTTLGLATVANTGSYTDLSNQPSLSFASTAQGALADTALQAGDSLDAGDLVNALPAIDGSNLTGVGVSTTAGDVGTYTTGRPANYSTYTTGATVAGSSLVVASGSSWYYSGGWQAVGTPSSGSAVYGGHSTRSGTWRLMSYAGGNGSTVGITGLWVRIS
jgi:hypothetical protein